LSRAYEHLAYEGIRILGLAFPYDAPLRESAGLPARGVKLQTYIIFYMPSSRFDITSEVRILDFVAIAIFT